MGRMRNSTAKPPKHLSSEARRWWARISECYEFSGDDAALLLLQTAMEAFDAMRQAEAALARDGWIQPDRFGVVRAHPMAAVLRDSRAAMMRALKALNFDIAPPEAGGR